LVDKHALADSRLIYSLTNGFDDTGAVAVWDDKSAVEESGKGASPLLYVGWIDASGVKSHKHFTGSGFGFWEIAYDKRLICRTKLFEPRCFHVVTPTRILV
jgi:hypothetical protein